MKIPEIAVDLALPPDERWWTLQPYVDAAKQLLTLYLTDLGGLEQFQGLLEAYRDACIDPVYVAELASIARMGDVSEEAVLAGNLYYDALKLVLGCTAFAVDTGNGPLHARNLDWWTENDLLSCHTLIVNYAHQAISRSFRSVGWPGFIGAFSGVAPGRFAVTLNAVLSKEPPAFAPPVTFLLRSVLETANTFEEAVDVLSTTEIASDCLLLITGTKPGEMRVVERTPTRAAVRYPKDGFIVVANDYFEIDNTAAPNTGQELQISSCGRFERATALIEQSVPQNAAHCFDILSDPSVKMGITVQQMVMSAASGSLAVQLPVVGAR